MVSYSFGGFLLRALPRALPRVLPRALLFVSFIVLYTVCWVLRVCTGQSCDRSFVWGAETELETKRIRNKRVIFTRTSGASNSGANTCSPSTLTKYRMPSVDTNGVARCMLCGFGSFDNETSLNEEKPQRGKALANRCDKWHARQARGGAQNFKMESDALS